MQRSRSLLTRSTAGLFAAALLLSACGSSDDKADEKTTTTKAEQEEATTTAAEDDTTTTVTEDDSTTTTEADGEGDEVDLASALPTPDQFGEGWTYDESEDPGDTAISTASEDECPAAAEVGDAGDDADEIARFVNDLGQTVKVTLSANVPEVSDADYQTVVDGITGCDPVVATEDDGTVVTADYDAALNDDYGPGIQASIQGSIESDGATYEVATYKVLFQVGSIGVTITGSDGLTDDGTVNRIDTAGLEAVATSVSAAVADLG